MSITVKSREIRLNCRPAGIPSEQNFGMVSLELKPLQDNLGKKMVRLV